MCFASVQRDIKGSGAHGIRLGLLRPAEFCAAADANQRYIMRTKNSLIPEPDTDLAGGLNELMIRLDEFQTKNSISNWRI